MKSGPKGGEHFVTFVIWINTVLPLKSATEEQPLKPRHERCQSLGRADRAGTKTPRGPRDAGINLAATAGGRNGPFKAVGCLSARAPPNILCICFGRMLPVSLGAASGLRQRVTCFDQEFMLYRE